MRVRPLAVALAIAIPLFLLVAPFVLALSVVELTGPVPDLAGYALLALAVASGVLVGAYLRRLAARAPPRGDAPPRAPTLLVALAATGATLLTLALPWAAGEGIVRFFGTREEPWSMMRGIRTFPGAYAGALALLASTTLLAAPRGRAAVAVATVAFVLAAALSASALVTDEVCEYHFLASVCIVHPPREAGPALAALACGMAAAYLGAALARRRA